MDTPTINIIRILKILAEGSNELVVNIVISDNLFNSVEFDNAGYHLNKWDSDGLEYQLFYDELTNKEKLELLLQLENLL